MREELDLRQAQDSDIKAFQRLLAAMRSFADQAESLFVLRTDSGSDEASRMEVNDLARSFWAAEDLIEIVLGPDRAQS